MTARAESLQQPTLTGALARKVRTQQRLLDAALEVFASTSYERATVEQISLAAGCSRVTFYAHFTDKQDLFRHLANQVARQLWAATEAMEPLRADAVGWASLHAWVVRCADAYDRYQPVFRVFGAAVQTDPDLGTGSSTVSDRNVLILQSKLPELGIPPRALERLLRLLIAGATRAFDISSFLRSALPETYTRARMDVAITRMIFRSLFGAHAYSPHPQAPESVARRLEFGPSFRERIERSAAIGRDADRTDRRALAALLEIGHDTLVKTSLHGQGVEGLVSAAGISHGAFYRYFSNRDDLVQVVATRALVDMSQTIASAPRAIGNAQLVSWLREYSRAHARSGALVRLWVESGHSDPLGADRAAAFDWGRRQLRRVLSSRQEGDLDADAVVLLAVVEEFGALHDGRADIDAAMRVLNDGFGLVDVTSGSTNAHRTTPTN